MFLLLPVLVGVGALSVGFNLEDDMRLEWDVTDTSISFLFNCLYGWCAIGFGFGMDETDMIIAMCPAINSDVLLWDAWSTAEVTPHNDTEQGGNYSLTGVSSTQSDTTFEVKFTRALDTKDAYDTIIRIGEDMDFVYAYSTAGSFTKHTTRKKGLIVIGEEQQKSIISTWGNYCKLSALILSLSFL